MENLSEELTLVDNLHYLHLKETQKGYDYVAYDRVSGMKEYSGRITNDEILDCPIRNSNAAARMLAIADIGYEGKVVNFVSLDTLSRIKEARRSWLRGHGDNPHPHSIRFITSHYDELFRIPDTSIIQIQSPYQNSLARCEYLDDYHFRLNHEVFHICQFAEIMERNGATVTPEPISTGDHGSWELSGKGYLLLQASDDGWDYSLLDKSCKITDGGQLDNVDLSLNEAREQILTLHSMEYRSRIPVDYDDLIVRMEQAEEKSVISRLKAIPVPKKGAHAPASKEEFSR